MTHKSLSEKATIPALIDLPVYRDTYCDQTMTDDLLRHLWEARPDLVMAVAEEETRIMPEGHDSLYGRRLGNIIAYLRERPSENVKVPPTRLGMLDLLYELGRRLRNSMGLVEVPVLGTPLAPSPEGPFPPLVKTPVWRSKKDGRSPVSQELADKTLARAYELRPDLFYEYAEQTRRLVKSYEITQSLQNLIKSVLNEEDKHLWARMSGEVSSRIYAMCDIPTFSALKEALNK